MTKALIVTRLSRVTDATTSPERQKDACQALCDQRGYEVVGIAEDMDVSAGKTSPFDRPQLGDWLNNRPHEFDVLVTFRMDRIVRRLFDLADLIRWCTDHSVAFVSATETFLDLTAPFGDIVALLVAKVAEMELAAIAERNSSAFRHNFTAGKYRGGPPPWGYLPSDATGEWRLVLDPEQAKVIRQVVHRVLDGWTLRALAQDLTARKVLTARDQFTLSQGRKIEDRKDSRCKPLGGEHFASCNCGAPYAWHASPLKRSLTSQTLLGYAVTREPLTDAQGRAKRDAKGRKLFGPETVVRNPDGSPLVRAEPVLTREVFDRVGAELARRENRKEPTKRSTALLLRVIYCGGPCSHLRAGRKCPDGCDGTCGKPAYRIQGKGRVARYRCSSIQESTGSCGNGSVAIPPADDHVTDGVLYWLGDSERLERVWDSGTDHSSELSEVNDVLTDLTGLIGTGVYRSGTPQRAQLDARIAAYAARQAELSAEAVKPAGWTWQPTGENFGEWWANQGVEARNIWLRSMQVRLTFTRTAGDPHLHLDLGDLQRYEEQLRLGKRGQRAKRQATRRV